MKRIAFLLLILSLKCSVTYAQSFRAGFTSGHASSNLAAGWMQPRIDDLRGHFETNYGRKFFDERLYCGGFLFRGPAVSNVEGAYDAMVQVLLVVPQAESVHDSLRFRLGGWQLGTAFFGKDALWFSEIFDLIIAPGWSFGNFHLRRWDDDRRSRYTNPFVGPKLSAEFRVNIKRFTLAARGEYLYDLTDPIWRRKTDFMPVLPWTYNRGLQLTASIGWTLKEEKQDASSAE